MKDHIARYGLEFDPFLKNAKYIPVKTAEAGEARIRLDYLGNTGGFGVLTGEPGNGKTTAGREWRSSLNPSLFKTSYNTLSTLTVMDFYRQIASGLGAEPSFRKNELFNNIQHEIKRYALEKGSPRSSSSTRQTNSATRSFLTCRSCSTSRWIPGTSPSSSWSGSPG